MLRRYQEVKPSALLWHVQADDIAYAANSFALDPCRHPAFALCGCLELVARTRMVRIDRLGGQMAGAVFHINYQRRPIRHLQPYFCRFSSCTTNFRSTIVMRSLSSVIPAIG